MWRRYDTFMSRLYGPLSSLWGKVLSGTFSLLMGVLGSYVYDELSEPKGSSLELNFRDLLRPSSLGIILLLAASTYLLLGVLRYFAQQAHHRHKARGAFDLIESAGQLPPGYLGFQLTRPGEPVPLDRRPFYEFVYVHRIAVPHHERAEETPQIKYEEAQLARFLEEGRGFVLLGPPLDGKSRTLYEILRNMEDHVVVVPKVNEKVPSDEAFSLLLRRRRVVLLLDDLTRYVNAEVDVREFWERLGRHTSSRVVAATCRDGPELSAVRDAQGPSLRWFYDMIPLKLSLLEASSEKKRWLAERIGNRQEGRDWEEYPELGHVTMEDPMNQMRGRFERLSHQSSEQRDALRALRLLSVAGVLPFTRGRLLAVMRSVFERFPAHLGDRLDALAEQSFLRAGEHNPVEPEPAYLRYVVAYSPGKTPEDDFPKLADVLERIEDTEGLIYLGTTYAIELEDYKEALKCFDRAVRLRPGDPQVWFGRGKAVRRVGDHLSGSDHLESDDSSGEARGVYQEALNSYKEAIRLLPSSSEAWYGKGKAFLALNRHEEAVDAFDKVVELKPDFHDAWCDKGIALVLSNRHQDALHVLDTALRLDPTCAGAWLHRGRALFALGDLQEASRRFRNPMEQPYREASAERFQESSEIFDDAVEALDKVTELDPDSLVAWMLKSEALIHSGRDWEAAEAIDKVLELGPPENPDAWTTIGVVLRHVGRYQDGLEAHDKALDLAPDIPVYWTNKGLALYELGRPWEEMAEAFDKAIDLRPDDPKVWYNKAATLANMGRLQEALTTYDTVIRLSPDFSETWFNKGLVLENLGYYQRALEAYDKASSISPQDVRPWDKKGRVLEKLGRYQEAQEAHGRAASLRLSEP